MLIEAVLLILIILLIWYWAGQEGFYQLRTADNNILTVDGEDPNIADDYDISPYGNISVANDIDMMEQRRPNLVYPNGVDKIDNSDVVDQFVSRGSSYFQPNMQGVTPVTYAGTSAFNMHEQGPLSEYYTPLEGRMSIDEMAARKQQHRAAINKKAIDGAVRSTRDIYERFFNSELEENEGNVWWSAEAAPIETDFRNY